MNSLGLRDVAFLAATGGAAVDLTDGLQYYLKLGSGDAYCQCSQTSATHTASGSPDYSGTGVLFDGSDGLDYFYDAGSGIAPIIPTAGNWTMGFSAYFTSFPSVSFLSNRSGSTGWQVNVGGASSQFWVNDNGYAAYSSASSASTSTWYMVMVWVAGDSKLRISVDNASAGEVAWTGSATNPSAFKIGPASSDAASFRVDNLAFWSRALSAAERTAAYNGGTTLDYLA